MLVQWIAANDEASIGDALGSRALANVLDDPAAEQIAFSTSSSGVLRLFDSSEQGDMLQGASEVVRLVPGDYCVRAGYLEARSLAIVVRRFSPLCANWHRMGRVRDESKSSGKRGLKR